VRRAQMILKSADEGLKVARIAQELGCSYKSVRGAIHAFHAEGLAAVKEKKAGRKDEQWAFDTASREQLQEFIRRSPRCYGHKSSLWTLDLLAESSFHQSLVQSKITGETVRAILAAMGIHWRRAKKRISSPDQQYEVKKSAETG
jgi:transposase